METRLQAANGGGQQVRFTHRTVEHVNGAPSQHCILRDKTRLYVSVEPCLKSCRHAAPLWIIFNALQGRSLIQDEQPEFIYIQGAELGLREGYNSESIAFDGHVMTVDYEMVCGSVLIDPCRHLSVEFIYITLDDSVRAVSEFLLSDKPSSGAEFLRHRAAILKDLDVRKSSLQAANKRRFARRRSACQVHYLSAAHDCQLPTPCRTV
jgi:hypothetical protein